MLNFIIPIVIAAIIAIVFIVALFRSIRIVPHKVALIVERLGKYHTTLDAGFHILFPFLDRVKYKQSHRCSRPRLFYQGQRSGTH